jgi:ribosomal protein L7/L12
LLFFFVYYTPDHTKEIAMTIHQELFAALLAKSITDKDVRKILTTVKSLNDLNLRVQAETVLTWSKIAEDAAKKVYPMDGDTSRFKELASKLDGFKTSNPAETGVDGWTNKITLIKKLREVYGLGLADAKAVSETLYHEAHKISQDRMAVVDYYIPMNTREAMRRACAKFGFNYQDVVRFVNDAGVDDERSRKIHKIKMARERFGFGLAQAKEFVETIWS